VAVEVPGTAQLKVDLRMAAAGVGALLAAETAAAQEITLKAAVFVPPSTTYGVPFKRFVDHVNETGRGLVQIRVVGGPEAVPAEGQAQAIKSGVLDLASIPPTYYKSVMVEGDAQVLTDMTVTEQRKSGAYGLLSDIASARMGAIYLTTYGVGVPFHLYLTRETTPLSKPEDLKGLRFRGQPNYASLFKHYGIAGANIAAPEVYTALERGTVHGYGWPLWGINDFGWEKLTKIRVDPGFYNVIVNILMNKAKYDSLSAGQRKVIDDAVTWFEVDNEKYTADKTKETMEMQDKAGIRSVSFGPEFKKIAEDLYWDDLRALSPDAIAKLRPLLTRQ
jgi:TRAP-type transport system periplasmic protein